MKKRTNIFAVLVALLLCTPAAQPARQDPRYPAGEIWNKKAQKQTIYYKLGRGATTKEAKADLARQTSFKSIAHDKFHTIKYVPGKEVTAINVKVGGGGAQTY